MVTFRTDARYRNPLIQRSRATAETRVAKVAQIAGWWRPARPRSASPAKSSTIGCMTNLHRSRPPGALLRDAEGVGEVFSGLASGWPGVGPVRRRLLRLRRAALVVGALALPLSTAGCTVDIGAVMGVGVDAAGRPVGYLRVCKDRIDGATLYRSQAAEHERERGMWSAAKPVTSFARWSLAEPGPSWTAKSPLGRLTTGEYTLYGWTNDNSSSAGDVVFTRAKLERLRPGEVLYWAGDVSKDGNRYPNVVVSETEFRREACKMVE
jgi:hypothetical protein